MATCNSLRRSPFFSPLDPDQTRIFGNLYATPESTEVSDRSAIFLTHLVHLLLLIIACFTMTGLDISASLLAFLQGPDCGLILSSLIGASRSVVTGTLATLPGFPRRCPLQMCFGLPMSRNKKLHHLVGSFTVSREVLRQGLLPEAPTI